MLENSVMPVHPMVSRPTAFAAQLSQTLAPQIAPQTPMFTGIIPRQNDLAGGDRFASREPMFGRKDSEQPHITLRRVEISPHELINRLTHDGFKGRMAVIISPLFAGNANTAEKAAEAKNNSAIRFNKLG